jgi:glycosyltransferase involved in cell wall biosynthesis
MVKTATLVISFYNNLGYLKLLLAALETQTEKNFEVIIADDGSDTKLLPDLENLFSQSPLKIIHIWQPDFGFRKNKILNKAIVQAQTEYIIFIDGDCVPHPAFVHEHMAAAEKNTVLTGRRVNLSEDITKQLSTENIRDGYLQKNFKKLVRDGIQGDSFDVEKGFYITNRLLRNFFNNKYRGILGCNFSAFKSDFLAINGFDERYQAPSIGEDSDVQYRFELLKKKIKSLNNIAVQYHLYHKIQPRSQKNLDLFEQVKQAGLAYTQYGINK